MKKYSFLLSLICSLFMSGIVFAKTPINENIIKYSYYVTTVSKMPEFQGDVVLAFEREISEGLLRREVQRHIKDYTEILNYIDTKSTYEIVIYKEFLKELKECLASRGIFPSKFNDMITDFNHIYTPIFKEFALGSPKTFGGIDLPKNVLLSRRIYPYLRNNVYFKKNQGGDLYKKLVLEVKEDEESPIDTAYKKAEAKLNEGYDAYCNGLYSTSCSLMNESLPLWVEYIKLIDPEEGYEGLVLGMICLMSGSSAVEAGNYNQAMSLFTNAAKYFAATESYKDFVSFAQCFMAEIFYREGDIPKFIEWMEISKKNGLNNLLSNKANFEFAHSAMGTKAYTIVYEYYRIKDPINTPETQTELRNTINSLIASHMNQDDSTSEFRYDKKFLQRYKHIMENNQIAIKEISFYFIPKNLPFSECKNYKMNMKQIKLKDINDKIMLPQWIAFENNGNYKVESLPIAMVKNSQIAILVKFFIPNHSNVDFNITCSSQNMKFEVANGSPATGEYIFVSDKPIDKICALKLEVNWFNNNVIIDRTTHNDIYVSRDVPSNDAPYYWQIADFTCKWLENIDPNNLDDETVINTIFDGLYKIPNFCYSISEIKDDTIQHLFNTNFGGGYAFSNLFIECARYQGVKEYLWDFKLLKFYATPIKQPNGTLLQMTRFGFKNKAIGGQNPPPITTFHVVVGRGGTYYEDPIFGFKGDVYDPTCHIYSKNVNLPPDNYPNGDILINYECDAVSSLVYVEGDPLKAKLPDKKQFNFEIIK